MLYIWKDLGGREISLIYDWISCFSMVRFILFLSFLFLSLFSLSFLSLSLSLNRVTMELSWLIKSINSPIITGQFGGQFYSDSSCLFYFVSLELHPNYFNPIMDYEFRQVRYLLLSSAIFCYLLILSFSTDFRKVAISWFPLLFSLFCSFLSFSSFLSPRGNERERDRESDKFNEEEKEEKNVKWIFPYFCLTWIPN